MAIDPVCGMEVDPKTAKWSYEYEGKMYYFCAPGCKTSFEKNPKKYLGHEHGHGEHGHGEHGHDEHGHHEHHH